MEDGSCDYLVKEHEVYLTENFVLPILYGTVEVLPYSETQATYTEEEARALAQQRLEQFCGQLEKSGVEISENNVTIELSGSKCITKGTLSVRKPVSYTHLDVYKRQLYSLQEREMYRRMSGRN